MDKVLNDFVNGVVSKNAHQGPKISISAKMCLIIALITILITTIFSLWLLKGPVRGLSNLSVATFQNFLSRWQTSSTEACLRD